MTLNLFKLQWKEWIRSSMVGDRKVIQIFSIFMIAVVITTLAVSGIYFPTFLELFYGDDIIYGFLKVLFYFFGIDLLLRLMFKGSNFLPLQPLLALPIKKAAIVRFVLLKSWVSIFTVVPIFLFTPFLFTTVYSDQDLGSSITLFVMLLTGINFNHYLDLVAKLLVTRSQYLILILFIVASAVMVLDYKVILPMSEYFIAGYNLAKIQPALLVVPVAFCALVNHHLALLIKKSLVQENSGRVSDRKKKPALSFWPKDELGYLISLELKLVFRNKRPRGLFVIGLIFILTFMYFNWSGVGGDMNYLILALMSTSIFSLNHSQYFFSWDSSFISSIWANNVSIDRYIKSKYCCFAMGCAASFIVVLPHSLLHSEILFNNAMFLLYNIGVSSVVVLLIASFNTAPITLDKGLLLNFEGAGVSQMLMIIPVVGLPFLVYFFVDYLHFSQFYFEIMGIIGLLGILFCGLLLKMVRRVFTIRKYKMIECFRNS